MMNYQLSEGNLYVGNPIEISETFFDLERRNECRIDKELGFYDHDLCGLMVVKGVLNLKRGGRCEYLEDVYQVSFLGAESVNKILCMHGYKGYAGYPGYNENPWE